MERDGIGYISPKFTSEDFGKLNLSLQSPVEKWEEGIEIFKDRIESRYFAPIETMLANHDLIEINGFAVMALNCLLVDTFYQFREPDNTYSIGRRRERHRRGNGECYANFLLTNFPFDFDSDSAQYFYTDIRCGILHSAQTKNGSQLTYDKSYVVEIFDDDKIRVDIVNFTNRMKEYYFSYLMKLEQGDIEIRKAFIKQMKKICRE